MKIENFIKEYNEICEKHLLKKSLLNNLTNHELYIWIAGKTYKYGRSLEDSLENAKIHLNDRVRAEKIFGIKKNDSLLF